jgi:hypothetical protein
MIETNYTFTDYDGNIVTVHIPLPINECRLRRKIEKDIKRIGPYGNPCFEYKLSKAELKAIREKWLTGDLFSEQKVSMR